MSRGLGDVYKRQEMYSAAQDEWQEVCLVLEGDAVGCVANSALVINRPIAKAMSRQLAELILNGGEDDPNPRYGPAFVDRFMEAFGDEAAVYVGGPEEQNRPGMLIHGTELDGAEELAPGTRIFTGGFEAAVAAVKEGLHELLVTAPWFAEHVHPLRVAMGFATDEAPAMRRRLSAGQRRAAELMA